MSFDRKHPDRGYLWERTQRDIMEQALAFRWENSTASVLEDILMGQGSRIDGVTLRDRYVAATVIQWLGTSVGFGFLSGSLQAVGFVLHREPVDYRTPEDIVSAIRLAVAAQEARQLAFDLSEPQ